MKKVEKMLSYNFVKLSSEVEGLKEHYSINIEGFLKKQIYTEDVIDDL